MGQPKYKKYPKDKSKSDVKDKESATEYQQLIKSSLKSEKQLKKAALILEIWLNSKPKKP